MAISQPGPNTQIVTALRSYGAVQPAFLAQLLGRTPEELWNYLNPLANEGVVQIRNDGAVALVEESATGLARASR
jgi:Mn-dependent DtxR family transcriptional regulator